MGIKSAFIGAALALTALATGAQAAIVTFEGLPFGSVASSYSEAGFTVSEDAGFLFGNTIGNPGHDLEGLIGAGGGVAKVVAADSSIFTFQGLDYAAWNGNGSGSQTLTVLGFLEGLQVGLASYGLANTPTFPYPNWTTFGAGGLSGRKVDTLFIGLNAGVTNEVEFLQAIDNVRLGGIPEPGVWTMMIVGLGGVGAVLRRRRGLPVAA
jgi:hypothetical protein